MKILIVDDEKAICFACSELFMNEGDDTFSTYSGEDALLFLEKETIDLAIIDYQLPGINGLELLKKIKNRYHGVEVILITGFGSEEIAMNAIKFGAYDYIAKPFNNMELINRVNHIRESLSYKKVEKEAQYGYYFSKSMKDLTKKVETIAQTNITVLITGETGTGKELIARLCHHYSKRTGQFIAVNCSALPESIIENELFGSEKGAFTGADKRKIGLFELADNGTIFLDEIGEMPISLQAKLLRVIQESEITRIGGGLPIKINTRIIAATNINIKEKIKEGKFREDLYFRLNVGYLVIPPLRSRTEDIKALSMCFLNDFSKKYHKEGLKFTDCALQTLLNYTWPGNIRELRNAIEKVVIFCQSKEINHEAFDFIKDYNENDHNRTTFDINHFFSESFLSHLPHSLIEAKKKVIENFEKQYIFYHLKLNNWNVKNTADSIGVYRQDLYKKIKKFNINLEN